MNPVSCNHVSKFKEDNGKETYSVIHFYFISSLTDDARKKKAAETRCHDCCENKFRIQACMSCVYLGCFDEGHIDMHAKTSGHIISVDIKYGNVYCHECKDYMYDEEFEEISKEYKSHASDRLVTKPYVSWQPTVQEIELLREHGGPIKIHHSSSIGLRGIINLGQTCFMSCILQVLVHTPVLRDYFLSDQHDCQQENSSECLACEMYFLFQEFYAGKSDPYSPSRLIYLMWTHAKSLVGYDQQDAHEFFIKILDILHDHCKDASTGCKDECACIIDQIFSGHYQSDIVCLQCKYVSTIFDPFFDISLNLGGNIDGDIHLEECIKRYTLPEKLAGSVCTKCQSKERTKQLTMKKLPIIICFHLKRLENVDVKKNSSHVIFPEYLDMAPFLAANLNRAPEGQREKDISDLYKIENIYCLYAVVTHIGTGEGGHYKSYVRQHRNRWYKCDDAEIVLSSTKDVLESEGYLLFYHKQLLEYGKNIPLNDSTTSEEKS